MSCEKFPERSAPQDTGFVSSFYCSAKRMETGLHLLEHFPAAPAIPLNVNVPFRQVHLAIGRVGPHAEVRQESRRHSALKQPVHAVREGGRSAEAKGPK